MHEPESQPWVIRGWATFWLFLTVEVILLAILYFISR